MSRTNGAMLGVLILVAVLGVLWPSERSHLDANSFGVAPTGHGAVLDLLGALGMPVVRNFAAPARLDPGGVVWWIEPQGWCNSEPQSAEAETAPAAHAVEPWLAAGGTAVVFLPARPRWATDSGHARWVAAPDCRWLGPWALPERRGLLDDASPGDATPALEEGAPEALGESSRSTAGNGDEGDALEPDADGIFDRWWQGELGGSGAKERVRERVEAASGPQAGPDPTPLPPRPRDLETRGLRHFEAGAETLGWSVRARIDGQPFLLERIVGRGRIAVLADGDFLVNRFLDRGDAAPWVVDLVRTYGVPRIDEYAHGLRTEERPLVYLVASAALPVFVGLVLLGAGLLWHGSAVPRRRALALDPAAPSLDGFVASLASLYAQTRDHARVAERYRELSLSRLRRHFGLPPDTPPRVLRERLRRQRRATDDRLALLGPEAAGVQKAADLYDRARQLDALVEEACR